jgi:hypothetical protein
LLSEADGLSMQTIAISQKKGMMMSQVADAKELPNVPEGVNAQLFLSFIRAFSEAERRQRRALLFDSTEGMGCLII